jgi:hypothetical protein
MPSPVAFPGASSPTVGGAGAGTAGKSKEPSLTGIESEEAGTEERFD